MAELLEKEISIHAPREGGDDRNKTGNKNKKGFQSTPPARGATKNLHKINIKIIISIHAPREGGDHRMTRLIAIK